MRQYARTQRASAMRIIFSSLPQGMRRPALMIGMTAGMLVLGPLLGGCTTMVVGGAATAATTVTEERGPIGAIDDNAIALRINKLWLDYDWHLFADVNTSVSEGRVLLTGKVAKREDEIKAVELAWKAEGVRQVIDDIQVTNQGGIGDYARDTWISTQLRTDMMFDKDIRAANYSVVTVGGVIYILGIAQNQAEIDRIVNYASNIPYVRGVVNHAILKDDARRLQADAAAKEPVAKGPAAKYGIAKDPVATNVTPAGGPSKPAPAAPGAKEQKEQGAALPDGE